MEISGPAGTGKSTIIAQLINLLGDEVIVSAFTGKASLAINGTTINRAFNIPVLKPNY